MTSTDTGLAHLAKGEFDQAIAAFLAATQGAEERKPWIELGVALALAERWRELAQVMAETGDPVRLFQTVALHLMRLGEYQVLGRMGDGIPEDSLVYPVAVYFAGVSRLAAKDYRGSLDHFVAFRRHMLAEPERFAPLLADTNFNVMFRQGVLVELPDQVAALDDGREEVEVEDPVLAWPRKAAPQEGAVLFASCMNDLYFLRFSARLVETLAAACGQVALHFHVAGSQVDVQDSFSELAAKHPEISLGLSLEPQPLRRHNVYYACDRFMVMPQLAAAYGRDIAMLDADALVKMDLVALFKRLSPDCDFACFDTGRTEPSSVYQATLMYFADSPGCRDFLRLLRRYIFAKIDQPLGRRWLLDQASLFSVSIYLEGLADRGFTFQRFDEVTGMGLDDFVTSDGSQTEKNALMQAGTLD